MGFLIAANKLLLGWGLDGAKVDMRKWTHPEEPAEVPARHLPSGALPGISNWEDTLEYTWDSLEGLYTASHLAWECLWICQDELEKCWGGAPSGITADIMTEPPGAKKCDQNYGLSSHLAFKCKQMRVETVLLICWVVGSSCFNVTFRFIELRLDSYEIQSRTQAS